MITYVTGKVAIGDAQDARKITQSDFDAALNVAIDLDICDNKDPEVRDYIHVKRYKVGLVDGPGNHFLEFVSAILLLEALVSQGKRVLVHCHAGQSRSVMIVSAWLTYKGFYPTLEDALNATMPPRKVTLYRQDLFAMAQTALVYIPKKQDG